jgi:hypothetical protein
LKSASDEPIFLFGICHRCGTSFFYHLMELHPDCGVTPITEDFLLSKSDDLLRFSRRVARRWEGSWKEEQNAEDVICEFLGRGLVALLRSRMPGGRNRRLFTKSPTVINLRYFPKFFPGKPLLILVRDGRSVTESLSRGMRLGFERAMRRWTEGARIIREFVEKQGDGPDRHLLIRFEDLVANPRRELTRVFKFLGLDSRRYDFKAARNLPVYGSSFFQGDKPGPLHWEPVTKTSDFQPLNRWRHWNRAKHARFNWVAGKYLKAFGYQEVETGPHRFGSLLKNSFLDALHEGTRLAAKARRVWTALIEGIGRYLARSQS